MLAFISPIYLWLLLVLVPLWALALFTPRRLPRWRRWGSLALRTLGVIALALALAGAQLVQPVDTLDVVFLLDSSDSVALSQRARAEAYVQQALQELPADARAGIVVFGEQALVERLPEHVQVLGPLRALPDGRRTNIQEAVQLGLALLPAESQRRLVLLSDGGENRGDAQEAARLALAQGVPIDVVALSGAADGLDAEVSGLELPAVAGEGQQLRMAIFLNSSAPTAARLQVEYRAPGGPTEGAQLLADQEVALTGEQQRFNLVLPPPPPGAVFNRYVVRVLAEGDARPENNVAEAFSLVRGRPRVLLVEGKPANARNLAEALAAADLTVQRVSPSAMPTGLAELITYDAVVLVDVPASAIPQRTAGDLVAYVRDLGRGVAMVGGPQAFGAGGWRANPLEAALPVDMDLRTEVRQPPVSIAIVIDVSGSMGVTEGGFTKVELAAEGAIRIATRLRAEDEITVIPFDSESQGIVGPLPGTQRTEAIDRIARITPGGGGINAYDALQTAAGIIRRSEKPVRHIITITDGDDTVQQAGARQLVATLRDEGVTVSSVAVGDGSDVAFLRDIVDRGAGRFFLTERSSDIPDILTSEAQVVIEPFVIEETFTPVRRAVHPILRNVEGVPPLYGYVATSPKASAQVLLTSPRNDPVLAVWQHGLGRSLAWTPDMRGMWARDWVGWLDYQRVASQMIAWLLPSADSGRMDLETRIDAGQPVLQAQVRSETGAPATGLRVVGQLIGDDGTRRDVVLQEVAPGSYRFAVQDTPPGAYLVQLTASDLQGQPQASVTGGTVVPFSGEYRSRGDNQALLDLLAATTGGRTEPFPAAAFDDTGQWRGLVREVSMPLLWLALLLLPLDVAIRRLYGGGWTGQPRPQPRRTPRPATTPRSAPSARAPTPQAASAAAPQETGDPLEKLRVAQQRARKRARGEE